MRHSFLPLVALSIILSLLAGSVSVRAQIAPGSALSMNGLNGYAVINLTNPPPYNYTISAWVYLRSGGDSGNRVAVVSASCGAGPELVISGASSTSTQYLQFVKCGVFECQPSTNSVPLSKWAQVSVQVTGSSPSGPFFANYFINGVAAGGDTVPFGNPNLSSQLLLGRNSAPNQRKFDGYLDEVQIWRGIVAPVTNNVLNGAETNLLAYYRFDEGSGTTAGNLAFEQGASLATLSGASWAVIPVALPPPGSPSIGQDWEAQGPSPITGAATGVNIPPDDASTGNAFDTAPHPTNADVIYLAAPNGGIWKTLNATSPNISWTPLTDFQPSLSMSSVVFDPTDPTYQTLVATFGSYSSSGRGSSLLGLLRTTDGGANWGRLSPTNLLGKQFISVAARGNVILAGGGAGTSLYRSTNGGTSFTNLAGSSGLTNAPFDGIAEVPGNINRFYIASPAQGVYRSDDMGATWTSVSSGIMNPLTGCGTNTTRVRISVHNLGGTEVVYAAVANRTNDYVYAYYSTNSGANWTLLGQVPGMAAGYSHFALAADPADPNLAYVSGTGIDIQRINRSTTNFTSLVGTRGPHADSHSLTMDASGNLIETDDGGVFLLPHSAETTGTNGVDLGGTGGWRSLLGNLQLTEFYGMAYDPNGKVVFGGTQDNAVPEQSAAGSARWNINLCCDGGPTFVDTRTTPGVSYRFLGRDALDSAGLTKKVYDIYGNLITNSPAALVPLREARFPRWYYAMELNAVDGRRLLFGLTNGFFESTDQGETLRRIGTNTLTRAVAFSRMVYGGMLNGIPNPDLIWACADDGYLYLRTNAVGSLQRAFFADAAGVVANPKNWQQVYVISPQGVYASTNAAGTWQNLTTNLAAGTVPFVPRSIEFLPLPSGDTLAVGTDDGVYVWRLGSPLWWTRLGSSLPRAIAFSMRYDPSDQVLALGTLGRGAWTYSLAGWPDSGGGPGMALDFNGKPGYVAGVLPKPIVDNYTVSAWINLRTGGANPAPQVAILSSTNCNNTSEFLIRSATTNIAGPQYLELKNCGQLAGGLSTGPVPLNEWVHVAVTVGPTLKSGSTFSNLVSFYIDGQPAGSNYLFNLSLALPTDFALALNDGLTREFDGLLDQVCIWTTNMPSSLIPVIMRQTTTGNAPVDAALAAVFNFDEGTGTNVAGGPSSGVVVGPFNWAPSGAIFDTGPGTIATQPAVDISPTNATLAASSSPYDPDVGLYFEYGLTTSYGTVLNQNLALRTAPILNGVSDFIATTQSVSSPSNFTISLWFKTSSELGGRLLGFGSSATNASAALDRHLYLGTDGVVRFGVYSTTYNVIAGGPVCNDGQWHHAAGTFSQADGMRLYVDGIQVANKSIGTAYNYAGGGYWRIGWDEMSSWPGASANSHFAGAISEVQIWNTVLDAGSIAYNRYLPLTGLEPGLVAYYHLNESSGTVATNSASAGASNNGQIFGAPVRPPGLELPIYFTQTVSNLQPSTTYHFRAVGTYSTSGRSTSLDQKFSTTPISPIVTTTADSGPGSLRYVSTYATNNATITFAPGLSGQKILLTSGQVALPRSLTIDGSALASSVRVDGNHSSRIFNVATGVVVTLNSLVLSNGYPGPALPGGAIFNSGNLTLANCTLAGNSAKFGGAINSQGSLAMAGCTVNNNAANLVDGGGILLAGAGNLTNCTFFGNTAVVGNGGAICQSNGVLTLLHCTLSGNTANVGGGIYAGGAALSVKNSILAGNNFRDVSNPGPGAVAFGGVNIVESLDGPFIGTIINANPLLGALGNNGGPTPTMLPAVASPAIDAGASSVAAGIPYDQRGPGFPRVLGNAVDIGAVETAYPPSAPAVVTQPATGLSLSGATLNATVTPNRAVTTTWFEWGPTASYGSTTPPLMLGGTTQPVSAGLTGLLTATLYHFRVVATNSAGTAFGNDLTFQTTLIPNLVYNTNDSGPGSLRNVIAAATNGATITFVPELSGATILLTSGVLLLNSNATIDASALPGGIRIDGNQATRIFTVASGVSVTLNSLVLRNAYAGANVSGGAIVNLGALTLNSCTLQGNLAGGNAVGGAIWNSGPLTLMSCTFAANTAGLGGAAIYNYSNCVAVNSTFSGNTASTGNGGAIDNSLGATLNLLQCTVSSNSAAGAGGGINNNSSQLNITNSIIAGNNASQAADINNASGSTVTSGGSNIVQSLAGPGTVNGSASIIAADPLLAPLANYGGPTQTMPPQTQSPAIDAGVSSAAAGLSYDQRGPGYPRLVGGAVDIGAVEAAINPYVFTAADSGYGSLRYTVNYATNGSAITFAPGVSGQTITLSNGQILLNKDLIIDASALAGGVALNANQASRIFNVPSGVSVTLNSLVLSNGYTTSAGGAILNLGALALNNCTLVGNSAPGNAEGGGIDNSGPLTLTGCTLSGNAAGSGGAIDNSSNCTLVNCTFSGNTVTFFGGAIENTSGATLNLLHCTVSSNNTSSYGGGIDNYLSQVNLTNSIVAGNTAINGGDDIKNWAGGTVTSGGSNIVQLLAGPGTVNGSASIIAANPLLAPLANYGGPTQTMPPQTQSPAIDAADSSADVGLPYDQRGPGYPRQVGGGVDIGAVEAVISPYVFTTADSGYGSLRYTVTYATNGSAISFAPPLSGQTITLTTGQIVLDKDLTIDASPLPGGVAVNGNLASRIFYVLGNVSVTINSLVLSNGFVPSGNWGGAIANEGNLALNRCTLSGNSVDTGNYGGAIVNVNVLTMINCTFSGNSGGDGGGAIENNSSIICAATNCTFASNSAVTYGGAIDNYGGVVLLVHCTLSGNTAAVGGALDSYSGDLTMLNTIAAANTGSAGADVYNAPDNTIALGGNNLVQDLLDDSGYIPGPLPLSGPPLLSPLGNYGGLTQTMPPLPGSPAVDAGDDAVAAGLATDQRGLPRLSGDHVDIGAAELQLVTAATPSVISNLTVLNNGAIQFNFPNQSGASFRVFAATNIAQPLATWQMIGFATESPASSGQFQFTDQQATNFTERYYRVRSP